jgi:pilus assembly protein CpaB
VSRLRRGILLAILSAVLGSLAASDIARREAALARRDAPDRTVVVARRALDAGRTLRAGDLAVRRLPTRFAPAGAAADPLELAGQVLAVAVPAGADVGAHHLRAEAGPAIAPGERAAEVTGAGSPELVVPGALVDVLVVGEDPDGAPAGARVALSGAEVLGARVAEDGGRAGEPLVTATLRVSVRQAVALAAAEAGAREVRLLARPEGAAPTAGG